MELNEKQLIAMAAIGAALWYFMRKGGTSPAAAAQAATKPAIAPAPAAGGIWDGFGVGGSLIDAMGQAAATAQPLPTPATQAAGQNVNTKAPPQTAMPSAPRAVFGGTNPDLVQSAGPAGYLDADGWYHYPDGSKAYTGGGTFGHLNNGKTQGQNTMAVLGY